MPAVRAQKRAQKKGPTPNSSRSDRIVELDGDTPTIQSPSRARKETKEHATPSTDIVEISSEEEGSPTRMNKRMDKKVTELEAMVIRLQKERTEARRAKNAAERRLVYLEDKVKKLEKKAHRPTIEASTFEDNISCEICFEIMWSPYLLPECGHIFCKGCIQDWFTATEEQYKKQHPEYHRGQLIILPPTIRNSLLYPHINPQQLSETLKKINASRKGPILSCPVCREVAKNRPVEDFTVKKVVRAVTAAQDESSPSKKRSKRESDQKNKELAGREDVWRRFFAGD